MSRTLKVDVGKNLDLIYWGDGTPANPGLSVSQIAQFWGIPKDYAKVVKERRLTEIDPTKKFKYTLAVGGFRSGKTFADIKKHIFKGILYPKYEALILRKRHEQLMNTYVKDFKDFIRKITDDHPELLILDEGENAGAYIILMRGPDKIPAKFIFRIEPDGDFSAIRDSLKGYELGGFTMEEGSQLKQDTFKVLTSRLSWKGGPCHGSILSNPSFRGQWLAQCASDWEVEYLNGESPYCLVIRSETYENAHNLPTDYIADQERLYKDDPVGLAMALKGADGVADVGRSVFINHWHDEQNIDLNIKFNQYRPLVRGWDFGKRNAACAFWQFTPEGHAVKISEVVIADMYIEQFVDAVISHTKQFYDPKAGIKDYGDFAGLQEKDTGASIQRVRDYTKGAIQITARYFGDIDAGLNHMKKLMSVMVNGKTRFRVHPRCKWSVEAYKWGYYYKVMSDGRLGSKPFENEYEHMMDADRYAVCNALPIEEEKAAEWTGQLKAKGPALRYTDGGFHGSR